jgi:hypothetical protein
MGMNTSGQAVQSVGGLGILGQCARELKLSALRWSGLAAGRSEGPGGEIHSHVPNNLKT